MSDVYLNKGAPWKRHDGSVIERGAEFVPTHDELTRKAHKLEYVEPGGTPAVATPLSADVEDYALGGGWYSIDGEKIQGRAAATERLAYLEGDA
jgi:hypothetical protein